VRRSRGGGRRVAGRPWRAGRGRLRIRRAALAAAAPLALAWCVAAPPVYAQDGRRPAVSPEQQVRRAFNLLLAAANRRDAASESEFFWKSDGLVSVAQGTPTLGWEARDRNARAWYASLARQKIVPGEVETRPIAEGAVALLAPYRQEIEAKDGRRWEGDGVWSLVFRRFDERWLVVWEHYSYERP
jgi:hypothetical protein